MTTIVATRKCLVADRKILVVGDSGSAHYIDGPKIKISACGTFAYGATGLNVVAGENSELEELFKTLVTYVNTGGGVTDEEFTTLGLAVQKRVRKNTLILTRKHFILIHKGLVNVADNAVDFFAVGTGEAFATMAMVAGKTPKQAVELACKLDTLSGGPLDVILASKLKLPKVVK